MAGAHPGTVPALATAPAGTLRVMAASPMIVLNDGVEIPQLGFGVYKVPPDEAEAVVATALEVGYRHIDTAKLYDNEEGVGRAVRSSGIPRDEIFVTTKVWNDDHGYDEALRAFDASMGRLGLDVLDLLLIHWPCPAQDRYVETWRALERLREDGRVRSIGVSNFHIHHLHRLLAETSVVPSINQVELHPLLPQEELRMFDAAHGIATEAWSPLARGALLDDPTIGAIAARIDRTPTQVVIAWHLALGNVVIPKSVTPARIAENFAVLDIELTVDDVEAITSIGAADRRLGADPDELG